MSKKLIIVLAVAAVATLATVAFLRSGSESFRGHRHHKNLTQIFEQWKKTHNKTYGGPESAKRFGIFSENFNNIEKVNSVKRNFTLGLNKFADLTKQEFSTIYLGLKKNPNATKSSSVSVSTVRAQDSVDWRIPGSVTDVKDQGSCGSCWAFSTTGSLEGLNHIKTGKLLSFSEQQLVDCAGGVYQNEGCNGGLMTTALQYVADNGITLEDTYPYTAQDGTCSYKKEQNAFNTTGYKTANSDSLLEAAVTNQPVSVSIEADTLYFQFYFGGVLDSTWCGTELDHGVLAVGYGKDASAGRYWIVKNSWGSSWGESGYVKIGRENGGDLGICGINQDNAYPTL